MFSGLSLELEHQLGSARNEAHFDNTVNEKVSIGLSPQINPYLIRVQHNIPGSH